MENPIKMGWFGGKPHYFRKHPYQELVFMENFRKTVHKNTKKESTWAAEVRPTFFKNLRKKIQQNNETSPFGKTYIYIFFGHKNPDKLSENSPTPLHIFGKSLIFFWDFSPKNTRHIWNV